MIRYLDIIRPYRPADRSHQPCPGEPLAESSRNDATGATQPADAGCKGTEETWAPRVEDVLAEMGRPGSGPAKALVTYREKPNAERLCWLTKAVLRSWAMETDGWERYVPVTEEAAATFGEYTNERNDV